MVKKIRSFKEYRKVYNESVVDPEKFWAKQAESFLWRKKWEKILTWDFAKPDVKWFSGGKLNITENCLDRHLKDKGDQVAIKWIANNPKEESISLTYNELHEKVCLFSNVLKNNGMCRNIVIYWNVLEL